VEFGPDERERESNQAARDRKRSTKHAAQRKSEISNLSEPLPRSAYDLQSRLYNIMRRNLIQVYFVKGDERTKSYVVNNTVYLVAQFQRITELMRQKRSNLSTLERAREHANSCSYKIKYAAFGEPMNIPLCCAFLRGNKDLSVKPRLSGEGGRAECMGYGAFLKKFIHGKDSLIDSLRAGIALLATGLDLAAP